MSQVTALTREHMKSSIPSDGATKQKTETMPLAPRQYQILYYDDKYNYVYNYQ